MTDFQALEALAREICDSRNGAGHYDAKGTKRAWWRKKAALMICKAASEPIYKAMVRACGWPL